MSFFEAPERGPGRLESTFCGTHEMSYILRGVMIWKVRFFKYAPHVVLEYFS